MSAFIFYRKSQLKVEIKAMTLNCTPPLLQRFAKSVLTNAVTSTLIAGAGIVLTANRTRSNEISLCQNGVANLGTFEKGTFVPIEILKEGFDTFHDTIQAIGDSCTSIIEKPINPKLINSNDSRIVLKWAKNIPHDLDLHMKGDDNCPIYYSHMRCGKSSLDRDNTKGGLLKPLQFLTTEGSSWSMFILMVHFNQTALFIHLDQACPRQNLQYD